MNAHAEDFVWYFDIRTLKSSFLNKQLLYINLARMDTTRKHCKVIIYSDNGPLKYIGTLLFRYYSSFVVHQLPDVNCFDYCDWLDIYPIQDFYKYIE